MSKINFKKKKMTKKSNDSRPTFVTLTSVNL